MANKALKEARKAYNRSKSTKNRIDIETGKKIKKKKKQETKSHYGQTEQTNKQIGGTDAKKAHEKNKTDKNPVKAHYGQVESKTRSTTGSLGTKISNAYKSNAESAQKNKSKLASSHFGQVTQSKIDQSEEAGKKKFGVGTYKGTKSAVKAKGKSDKAYETLAEKGKKKVQTLSKEELKKQQDEAEDRAARETAWYTRQLMARGRMTQDEADVAVKTAKENARKKVKDDHTLEYSNSTLSNEDIQRINTASKFANTKVKDVKESDKAKKEAAFYAHNMVARGEMTQEEANKFIKKAGKGHYTTQSANILDELGGKGFAEDVGTRQAGQLNDSKFFSGVLQGLSYGDNTRAVGKYNQQAAELVNTVKQSGTFNAGYMTGQGLQFMLGGTNKMTDALVKGVTKGGAMRSALNVGLRKGGADMMFEAPLNTLDAIKMSTDANGNFDKKAFFKYMALNTGLSGGMGGAIGGIGAKMTKNDVRVFANLSEKLNKNIELTPDELSQYSKIQNKLDNALKGNDRVKEDYINAGKADAVLSKADNKEYMSLLGKKQTGNLTQQERVRLSSYENVVRRNYDEAQNNYAKVLSDAAGGEKVNINDVKEATEFFERSGNVAKATEAETILETTTKERQLEIIKKTNPKDDSLGDHTWIESADDIKTFDEAINSDEAGFTPDFTKEMADEALEKGEITVYSSKPIEDGAFVTPSKMEAESYAGGGEVFEQTIKTDDVAWLDELQGQVAKISDNNIEKNSDLVYNNNGGKVNGEQKNGLRASEREVQGRQIQSESNRKVGEEKGRRLEESGGGSRTLLVNKSIRAKMNTAGIADTGLREVDEETFSKALEEARKANPRGDYVDGKTAEELKEKGAKCLLSEDGMAGVCIERDGNISGVFKHPNSKHKAALRDLIITARENGGTKMDCFGEYLADGYSQCGFIKANKIENNPKFSAVKDDVYTLYKSDATTDEVLEAIERGDFEVVGDEGIPFFSIKEYGDAAYDEALAHRDGLLNTGKSSIEKKPPQGGSFNSETPTETKPKPEETKSEPVAEDNAGYTTYASPRLKAMTNTAKEYGVDVTSRVDEFNSLGEQIKGDRAHIANVKKSTKYATEAEREARIAELEAGIEKANVLQTQIAESIYRDVADARKALGDKMGWSPKSIDTTSAKEIRTATENIGGVGTMANDIKKANKGSGSKKAQKLVSEEIKDYDDCLDKYLKGGEDPDMQNARASALLENIAERLSKNQDDADAMSDLMKVVDKLSEDGTLPSNVRSSAKILATSTPKGRVGVALKAVEDLNKKYGENIEGTLKLTDEEKVKLATTTGEELDDLYKEITDRLWDNIPATRIEKANEIRHMFMLTNVRTHARNMFGNLSFRGVRNIADDIEVQLQTRVFKNAIEKRGGEVDRVKVKKAEIKENEKYLTDEFHAIYDTSDSVNRYIETNRPDGVPIVKQKQLNWLIQKDYKLLEKEDMMTFIPAFRKSYMQYVNAKGWDISNMTEAQKKMARERALFDAEYATFRDTSALSAWLTGKKHQLATKQGKTIWETGAYRLGNVALEGLMPFVKTPVNIFRRSVDYSPISLMRCIGELASKDVDTFKQGIKHLSTGLTGTGVFGLGVFLANNDYISIDTQLGGHSGSKYYDQDMGYQDYSLVINIGGIHQSWTIDWLQPMQASLFMGAAFNDMWGDVHDGEGNLGTDTISALFAITSPMLDASFMSSTKDMIETFQRRAGQETAEGEPDMAGALAQALFGDLPKNYISSAVPQLISQSANVIDPYKRDTRSTLEDPILASWDSAGKQMLNRIPVLRQKLLNPKIDRWGDDVKTGNNVAIRLFNSMLNPSNVKDITENKYDRELIKIRNNGTEKGSNDYKFFFYNFTGNPQYDLANGKRMNYKELYEYGKSNRIEQTQRVHDMVDSKSYDGMTWDMRAKEVDNAHWIGNMVADHDTYGVNYAIKAMKKSTSSRDESDAKAYERYVANAGKNKDNEKFWDYRVNKERMYSRAHATGDDTYRIKGLCAIQTGDDNLVKSLNLKGGKEEDARKYWKLVKSEFGKKAKDQAFKEVTDGCCFIESNLKTAKVEGTDLGIKSAAAGVSAKNGNKIDERVYRFLGHFWNSAQAGGGLQLKYNKNGKYDLKALEAMSDQLDAKIEARPKGMSQKDVVCDFIENDLKITNADEAACVYQSLYLKGNGKRWKNPYKDTIDDHLEWGENHDDEWGVSGSGSGGGRGRRGRRGRGGGGGGSSKGTMPKTDTGAIKGKVTDVFSTSNGSKDSNLNDAYRKRARKLRESTNK